jgi:hypothetical protein
MSLVRLLTVQDAAHWRRARQTRVLTGGSGSHVDIDWLPAYDWMRGQMRRRLPSFSGDYPVWAWPDTTPEEVRSRGGWGNGGEEMVLLTLEVPASRVLLSDFLAWHSVLNHTAIGIDDDRATPAEREASWERIFYPAKVDWTDRDVIQACIDRVYLPEIVSETYFVVEPDESV